jgi:hypothetical protein
MLYRLAADAVLGFHLAFIVFALLGALLTVKWRWIPLVHLPTAAWAAFVELSGRLCPLTYVENDLRALAGQAGYEGGFIEHYLLALIYPSGLTTEVQYILAAVVLATNTAIYAWLFIRRNRVSRHGNDR